MVGRRREGGHEEGGNFHWCQCEVSGSYRVTSGVCSDEWQTFNFGHPFYLQNSFFWSPSAGGCFVSILGCRCAARLNLIELIDRILCLIAVRRLKDDV